MAGDWIPMRTDLARDPAVIAMALHLGITPQHVVGCLHSFWSWFSEASANGHAPVTLVSALDGIFGHAGMTEAMKSVGWLKVSSGSIEVPKWERWFSQAGKRRLLSARRKQVERVRKMSRSQRDKNVTREEKRRVLEDPLSPKGGNVAAQRRRRGTTYRAHEAARDEAVGEAFTKKAQAVIEASKAAEAEAHPPPEEVLKIAERHRMKQELSERAKGKEA